MTFPELISGLEKEYECGKYSQLQMELIGRFLSDNQIDFVSAAEKILGHHSKSYKSLPDYAMFKKCFESDVKARDEAEAVKAYAMLERKSHRYSSLAIKGSRLITALDRIGGWMYFCDRTVDEAPFMKERFIKAFVSASGGDDTKKYSGDLDTADNNMIFIGCDRKEFFELEHKRNPIGIASDSMRIKFDKKDMEFIRAETEQLEARGI
jgi:hypothetical protein